jgi:acyl transferase domain-containing protein
VPLPTYPFERKRFWADPDPPTQMLPAARADAPASQVDSRHEQNSAGAMPAGLPAVANLNRDAATHVAVAAGVAGNGGGPATAGTINAATFDPVERVIAGQLQLISQQLDVLAESLHENGER